MADSSTEPQRATSYKETAFGIILRDELLTLEIEGTTRIEEIVTLLTWFQHQLVYIHPFQDYNGRLARMLTTLLLLVLKLPPAFIKVDSKRDRDDYLQAMQLGDQGDLSRLEKIIASSLTRALEQ